MATAILTKYIGPTNTRGVAMLTRLFATLAQFITVAGFVGFLLCAYALIGAI